MSKITLTPNFSRCEFAIPLPPKIQKLSILFKTKVYSYAKLHQRKKEQHISVMESNQPIDSNLATTAKFRIPATQERDQTVHSLP